MKISLQLALAHPIVPSQTFIIPSFPPNSKPEAAFLAASNSQAMHAQIISFRLFPPS